MKGMSNVSLGIAISIGLLLSCTSYVDAHGRLTLPTTRDQVAGVYEYQMNAPSGYSTDFVCRGFPKGSSVLTITAGSTFSFSYTMTALHPGDCFLYISYDVDADPSVQQWFKIAEIAYCQLYSGQTLSATMPSWVKSGSAVLRWEWYALHLVTTTEFYAQCSDITIVGNANGCVGTPLVTVPGNLPADNANLLNYRLAFDTTAPFFFTGPAVATSTCGTGSGSSSGSTVAQTTKPPTVTATTSAPRVTTAPVVTTPPVQYCPTQQAAASKTVKEDTTHESTRSRRRQNNLFDEDEDTESMDPSEDELEYAGDYEGDVSEDQADTENESNLNSAHFSDETSSSHSFPSVSSDTIMVAAFVAGCIGLFSGVGMGFLIHSIVNRKKIHPLTTGTSVELNEGFIAI